MISTEELLETKNAMWKREDQLQRWDASDTNKASASTRSADRVRFQDSCVFLAACASGDTEEVTKILKGSTADINTANVDGLTALHQACIDDNLDMVQFLVSNGAHIDACDNEGWTSLHATASCGFTPIARYLIEHGARLDAVNNDGELAIDLAEGNEMESLIADAMEKQGIDADAARCEEEEIMLKDVNQWLNSGKLEDQPHPKTGATALHIAAAKGYIKVLKLLLEAGADKEARDVDGWTPMHAAAHWAQEEACRILADNLVNMDSKTNSGETVLDVADSDVERVIIELKRKQATIMKERDNKVNGDIIREQSPAKRRTSITSVTRMSGDQKHSMEVKNREEERAQLDSIKIGGGLKKDDEDKSNESDRSVKEAPPALPTSPPPPTSTIVPARLQPLVIEEAPPGAAAANAAATATGASSASSVGAATVDASSVPVTTIITAPAVTVAPSVISAPGAPSAAPTSITTVSSTTTTVADTNTASTTAPAAAVELVRRAEKREGSPAGSVAIDAKKPATTSDKSLSSEAVTKILGNEVVSPSLSEKGSRLTESVGGGVELRSVRGIVNRVTSTPVPQAVTMAGKASTVSVSRNTLSSSSFSGTRVLQDSLLPSQWRASLRKIGSSTPFINECGAARQDNNGSSRYDSGNRLDEDLNHYSVNGYGGSLNRSFTRGGVLRTTSVTVGNKYVAMDADSASVTKRPVSALTAATDEMTEHRNRTFEPAKRDEEKEIERKARAKRARETRRSTQGVCKEDLEKAEEALKAARTSTISSDKDMISTATDKSSAVATPRAIGTTAATTTNSATDVPTLSTGFSRSLLRTAGKLPMTTAAAPVITSTSAATSTTVPRPGSTIATSTSAANSSATTTCTDAADTSSAGGVGAPYSRMSAFRSRYLQEKAEREEEERRRATTTTTTSDATTESGQLEQKEDDSSMRWSSSRSRRKRESRPLTGRIAYDNNHTTLEDTNNSEESKSKVNNEVNSITKTNSSLASDILSRSASSSRASAPIASSTSTYTRFPYASSSSLNRDIDYKKLYEEEKQMNEQLKKEMKQLQADAAEIRVQLERLRAGNLSSSTPSLYRRATGLSTSTTSSSNVELRPAAASSLERRALDRKISELEKELKDSETSRDDLNSDNQRLKEENAALIRVISKLSK